MAGRAAGRPGDGAGRRSAPPTTSARSSRRSSRTCTAQDLTPLEEAAAYQQLIEDFELTHDDVAQRVGKSRSAVTNTLRLLGLPPAVQHLLADGKLSAGHARALLGTPDRRCRSGWPARRSSEGWSVRTVEEWVRNGGAPPRAGGRRAGAEAGAGADRRRRPHRRRRGCARPVCSSSSSCSPTLLDTRVGVQMGAKRGRVTIDFADLEDLERIYRRIAGER